MIRGIVAYSKFQCCVSFPCCGLAVTVADGRLFRLLSRCGGVMKAYLSRFGHKEGEGLKSLPLWGVGKKDWDAGGTGVRDGLGLHLGNGQELSPTHSDPRNAAKCLGVSSLWLYRYELCGGRRDLCDGRSARFLRTQIWGCRSLVPPASWSHICDLVTV